MELEHATSPLDDGRDVVIYPAGVGWGFRLPPQHTVTINKALGIVHLATPDHGSGYRPERLEETEEGTCGWLKDRYGVSWQIVPSALPELLADPDREKSQRVMRAMLSMKKIEIDALERAAAEA